MDYIEINGGHPLEGEVRIQGSKNAALPILAAAVLHKGITVLHNCPRITDVMYMIQILEEMGCRVSWEERSLYIDATTLHTPRVSVQLGNKMRCSIILMGALLGRMKEGWIPFPGGCTIGARPIDMHVNAFKSMGAGIEERDGMLYTKTAALHGSRIIMKFPSVGATENVILAAVLAAGVTVIEKGAKEPEIVELCNFLNDKGARISGAGTDRIEIEGVASLIDSEYRLMPDRIVAGTYLMSVLATRGSCFLEQAPIDQMGEIIKVAKHMGAVVKLKQSGLFVDGSTASRPITYLETCPYPGFPTDLQSQVMAVLCIAEGESRIREVIFEARFKAALQMNRMGANITIDGQEAAIHGVSQLRGGAVAAPELRGGAALVIAGLAAAGTTTVEGYEYIQRGYEDICKDLRQLGAQIYLRE